MDKLVIIDGNSLINRAFYALPLLTNKRGEFSNGVYGFANILIKAILDIKPKYIAVAMDYGKKTFRNELFNEYKGKRKETPHELKSQFPILKSMLKSMGIKCIEIEGYEADDIIGTLSCSFNTENIIITGDRDSLQLINDKNTVYLTKKGISEVKIMDEKAFTEEYGLVPNQMVDLKSLMGDSSDNIPGVKGVGEKTALELMKKYGSLDNIYSNLDELRPKLKDLMEKEKDMAYLSQKLSRIITNMDLNVSLDNLQYSFPFNEEVYKFFNDYDFNSLVRKTDLFNMSQPEEKSAISANIINLEDLSALLKHINYIKQSKKLAIDICGDKLHLAYDKNCELLLPSKIDLTNKINLDEAIDALKEVLEDEKIEKFCYDIKTLKHYFQGFGIALNGAKFDALLAFYLIYAGEKEATKVSILSQYSMSDDLSCVNLFYLNELLYKEMEKAKLVELYETIEMPLINVLFEMENNGFKIDTKFYKELKNRYSAEVKDMEQNIKRIAGYDFNINSPKQLSEVLFDKLCLVSRNNKKHSTSIEHLEEMYDLHPIIPAIIRYRKVNKFLSTYVEPYDDLITPSNPIIHTVFNQTLTQTGRLSSSRPNLQNIPVRDDEGKTLRKMFISSFEDGGLVSADYSQIELRLLAHMCGDENLIDAFKHNIDIHSVTASEIFDVPIQDVTPMMRRTAKATNFGIIYGISDFGLSQNINSTRKEAKMYIEKYFAKYPKIKKYMDDNVEKAKETGYSFTLFNRRRRVLELNSSNYNTRQFGERIAMNMPLQGSASDIIKLAMINVYKELKLRNLKSKMILQVHDELIIDCPREEITEVATILKENMENVVTLSVPLSVDVSFGKTWFDC